jgi:hypothetical protein
MQSSARSQKEHSMRFLVRFTLPTETVNVVMQSGKFASTMQSILDAIKPEAVYFIEEQGLRTGIMIVDMQAASQIPAIAEPFFQAFDASVEFHPTMSPEDLAKAGPAIERAAREYGQTGA